MRRKGWHLAITWDTKWKPVEAIAIQAVLGSDPQREALNLLRIRSGDDVNKNARWTILFKRKLA